MRIQCQNCNKSMNVTMDSYHFCESGLDNVYIRETKVYKCDCGESAPSIYRIKRLNELLAIALLEKPSLLSGKEIKFLRKNIQMSSKIFAGKLGVGNTTLSKWENEKQRQSGINDRHIRSTYMIYKDINNEIAKNILNKLSSINLSLPFFDNLLIANIVDNDYIIEWSPFFGAISEKHHLSLDTMPFIGAKAVKQRSTTVILHENFDISFASNEVLSTGTTESGIKYF
jgi:putative zinc finger/helix-turn-helix YgiT family protein